MYATDLQIEVTEIVIRKNEVLGKRRIDFFKRLLFFSNIEDVMEYSYQHEHYYNSCSGIMLKSGQFLKVKENYEDIKEKLVKWYELANIKEQAHEN